MFTFTLIATRIAIVAATHNLLVQGLPSIGGHIFYLQLDWNTFCFNDTFEGFKLMYNL